MWSNGRLVVFVLAPEYWSMADEGDDDARRAEAVGRRQMMLIGGLLLLICVLLAVLWMAERRRRIRAEARLAERVGLMHQPIPLDVLRKLTVMPPASQPQDVGPAGGSQSRPAPGQ